MSDLHTAPSDAAGRAPNRNPGRRRAGGAVARWMVSFIGYPLGGYAALLLVGRVQGPGSALAGGLLAGVVLGAVQAWALGRVRPPASAWILATGAGLMVGVTSGAALVDYRTDLRSLVVQGMVSGTMVGIAQSVVLYRRLGALVVLWPINLGVTFALGWAVTTTAGIDVDQQFTLFGSSGALLAALLTVVLPLRLNSHRILPTGATS
jgi:hypothetical protein